MHKMVEEVRNMSNRYVSLYTVSINTANYHLLLGKGILLADALDFCPHILYLVIYTLNTNTLLD